MYSLSTSWNSRIRASGAAIVEEIRALGFEFIELGFALTVDMVEEISAFEKSGIIKVSSLHNICPCPTGVKAADASPDYYDLSSADEAERELALDAARNTIFYANRLGAKAVVLHTGRVPVKDRMRELAGEAGDRERFESVKRQMALEREEKKGASLDRVLRSLKELVSFAGRFGVKVAIENRYSYRDIPLVDEFDLIFKEVRGAWYWHDVGHAEVFQRLGLGPHLALLEKFHSRLIGVHLHDIINVMEDHRAPLTGTFDFNILKPYIAPDTIKVIEAHQPASAGEIRRGLDYLKGILGE